MIGPLAGLADDVFGLFARYSGGLFGKNAPEYEGRNGGTVWESRVLPGCPEPATTGRWLGLRKKDTAPPGTGRSSAGSSKKRSRAIMRARQNQAARGRHDWQSHVRLRQVC